MDGVGGNFGFLLIIVDKGPRDKRYEMKLKGKNGAGLLLELEIVVFLEGDRGKL